MREPAMKEVLMASILGKPHQLLAEEVTAEDFAVYMNREVLQLKQKKLARWEQTAAEIRRIGQLSGP